jgi:peptide/nickel transport system substrate-binding protein
VTDDGAGHNWRRPRIQSLWERNRSRWTLPLVIIVIIGAVALIDHLGAHRISQVDSQSAPALVASKGGAATVVLDRPWDGFNPNTPQGADSSTPTLLSNVLPSAYIVDDKLVPEVDSDLLTSVETTSTSPLTIQYVINPKAVWSDGVPFTADDFIYAWLTQRGGGVDTAGEPDQVASTLGYRDVSTVTSSHAGRTVTVTFATPYTDWRDMFDHMVPAHIARQVGWSNGFDSFSAADDLSAGPYLLSSATPSGSATLVRNPHWWGTPAVLDRINVVVTANMSTSMGALAASNHVVAQPGAFDLGTLNRISSLPNSQSAVKPSLQMLQLDFDMTSPVLDRAGREAVAHAVNRADLLAQTFGSIDDGLVVNEDHLATPTQSSYAASSAAGGYDEPDPKLTNQLLRSAGYLLDSSGQYVDAAGNPLVLRMAVETGDPWITGVAAALSAQLRVSGITVVTTLVNGQAGMVEAAAGNDYDMALVTRNASPFMTTTSAWFSDSQGPVGSSGTQNWSKLSDPEVDQLFIKASEALNPDTGGTIYGQIDDQLWDQMVALPLFGEPGLLANGVQVDGQLYNPSTDGVLWNSPQWTLLQPGPSTGGP